MNEREYLELAAACDRLLRAADTSLARLAIPMLHLINEHPACLALYDALLRSPPDTGSHALPESADTLRTALRSARALLRSFRDRCPPLPVGLTRERVDVLIVSHLVDASQLLSEDDFYFGSLRQLLRERGAASRLVMINHLAGTQARNVHRQGASGLPHIVLPDVAPPDVEAGIWRQCFAARRALRAAAVAADDQVGKLIATTASRHAGLTPTAANLRVYWSISQICALLTPAVVLTTYEGAACERMIWAAARNGNRKPLCVGYQHTRLLAGAHAIRRAVGATGLRCDPDVILTLGDIPHASLAASNRLGDVQLIKYGSHRRPGRRDYPPLAHRPNGCLVLPDADLSECAILFEFAIACARQLPRMEFTLRPHPTSSLDALRSHIGALRRLPDNARLSARTALEDDCSRARYCLYRGSSAALHVLPAGIKPFYVSRGGEHPFDPLSELAAWRETVTSPNEFVARVTAASPPTDPDALNEALSFYDRYVAPIRPAAVDELLRIAGQRAVATSPS